MTQNSLTIIGSGLAGYSLVREIRRLDRDIPITVMTADNGDYYSKPQLSNALTNHKSPEQLVMISAEKFAIQFNINLVPNTLIQSLDNIQSSKIVFATGAKAISISPSPLAVEGAIRAGEGKNILSVNNLQDYQYFRKAVENHKNIAIIGAGLVGCEFANDLINTDYQVTIIAPEAYPLARLVPQEIGFALKKAFEQKGVNWRLGELFNPASLDCFVRQEEAGLAMTPGGGEGAQANRGREVFLSAIGLKPEITLAQDMGIKTNRGIIVDQYLQTNQENIYALGDCMEFDGKLMPYIAPIAIAARALAKTLLGEPTPVIYPPMPIYIKTPAYPVIVLQPDDSEGEWQIEQNQDAVRALFYNNNKLTGFALGGSFTSETVDWLKAI